MASTNKTPHYGLSQFLEGDKASWLTDVNSDMSKIDTAIFEAKTSGDEATGSAANALSVAQAAQTVATNAGTSADNASASASQAKETATTALTTAVNAQTTATNAETLANNSLKGEFNNQNKSASNSFVYAAIKINSTTSFEFGIWGVAPLAIATNENITKLNVPILAELKDGAYTGAIPGLNGTTNTPSIFPITLTKTGTSFALVSNSNIPPNSLLAGYAWVVTR